MADFIQFVILGLGTGSIFAFVALGLVLVYRGSGVVNFSQGAIALSGAAFFYETNQRAPVLVALLAAIVGCAFIGALIQLLVMRPMRGSSPLARLIATLGLLTVGLEVWERAYPLNVPPDQFLPDDVIDLGGGVVVPESRLYLLGLSIILGISLWALYRYTRFGLATTAVAENEAVAAAQGWSPNLIATLNWGARRRAGRACRGVALRPAGHRSGRPHPDRHPRARRSAPGWLPLVPGGHRRGVGARRGPERGAALHRGVGMDEGLPLRHPSSRHRRRVDRARSSAPASEFRRRHPADDRHGTPPSVDVRGRWSLLHRKPPRVRRVVVSLGRHRCLLRHHCALAGRVGGLRRPAQPRPMGGGGYGRTVRRPRGGRHLGVSHNGGAARGRRTHDPRGAAHLTPGSPDPRREPRDHHLVLGGGHRCNDPHEPPSTRRTASSSRPPSPIRPSSASTSPPAHTPPVSPPSASCCSCLRRSSWSTCAAARSVAA